MESYWKSWEIIILFVLKLAIGSLLYVSNANFHSCFMKYLQYFFDSKFKFLEFLKWQLFFKSTKMI